MSGNNTCLKAVKQFKAGLFTLKQAFLYKNDHEHRFIIFIFKIGVKAKQQNYRKNLRHRYFALFLLTAFR